MGLVLDTELETGVVANYYKIIQITIDTINNVSSCVVFLYKDQEARNTNKQQLKSFRYDFLKEENPCTIENMDLQNNNVIKLMYEKIKTLEQYTDAVDDVLIEEVETGI